MEGAIEQVPELDEHGGVDENGLHICLDVQTHGLFNIDDVVSVLCSDPGADRC